MLKTIATFSLISLLLCQLSHAASYKPKLIDRIDVKYPGFVSFIPSTVKGSYHLAITAFNGAPLTSDHVYYVANYTGTSHDQIVELSHTNVLWPNEATFTNETIISDKIDPFGGVLVPSGFLVPTKEDGGLFYYPFATADRSIVRSQPPIELSTKTSTKNTYFYHRLKFVDLSADGKVDLLTCRTHKPVIGSTKTQLVGYVLNEESLVFEEKLVLNEACDVFFEVADIDSDGRFEIIAAGYFIQKLNLIYSDDPENSFLTGKVQVKAIDTTGGKFFDVKASDLDLDKTTFELLVTNHQGNKDTIKSSLFYYKLTGGNLRTGNWSRTTIYDNFPVLKQGIQQASPGAARTLYPLTNSTKSTRPYLLVAGDGAEYLYLFEPSPIGQELSYNLTWSQDFMDTVGGISIADINNDGVNEFAVAVYEKNACFVFTLVSD